MARVPQVRMRRAWRWKKRLHGEIVGDGEIEDVVDEMPTVRNA